MHQEEIAGFAFIPEILHLLAARQESGRKWSFLMRKAEKVAPGLEKVEARLKKEKEQLPVEPPWLGVR